MESLWEEISGGNVLISVHDYKYLRAAVMTCEILVNTQTDTETDSFLTGYALTVLVTCLLIILLAQPAEQKSIPTRVIPGHHLKGMIKDVNSLFSKGFRWGLTSRKYN